ncbi:hypothetical protein TELCIR_15765 [Teladorsagia circumcincta]|uniref:Uncharacterized protein n=1 Tax=Teladorsagia circumcincta TaxID=45464 RepID=A0A2G9TXK1_TELCI|nr:hypothetical protein TELCIR_15765 [Teladorsagia circumcincta]
MSLSGFHFGTPSIEKEISQQKRDDDPFDYWADIRLVPTMMTVLRNGCEGHVADQQPAYTVYASTDETISFDLLPVCFATSRAGSLWAVVYYSAQFLYTSLGPMIVFVSFIYQSFVDDVPTVQNFASLFFAFIVTVFAVPSVLLYMPVSAQIDVEIRSIFLT